MIANGNNPGSGGTGYATAGVPRWSSFAARSALSPSHGPPGTTFGYDNDSEPAAGACGHAEVAGAR